MAESPECGCVECRACRHAHVRSDYLARTAGGLLSVENERVRSKAAAMKWKDADTSTETGCRPERVTISPAIFANMQRCPVFETRCDYAQLICVKAAPRAKYSSALAALLRAGVRRRPGLFVAARRHRAPGRSWKWTPSCARATAAPEVDRLPEPAPPGTARERNGREWVRPGRNRGVPSGAARRRAGR